MPRITRLIALTIVFVIALVSTLYVGYDRRAPTVTITHILPHENDAPQIGVDDTPASFASRFYFKA